MTLTLQSLPFPPVVPFEVEELVARLPGMPRANCNLLPIVRGQKAARAVLRCSAHRAVDLITNTQIPIAKPLVLHCGAKHAFVTPLDIDPENPGTTGFQIDVLNRKMKRAVKLDKFRPGCFVVRKRLHEGISITTNSVDGAVTEYVEHTVHGATPLPNMSLCLKFKNFLVKPDGSIEYYETGSTVTLIETVNGNINKWPVLNISAIDDLDINFSDPEVISPQDLSLLMTMLVGE